MKVFKVLTRKTDVEMETILNNLVKNGWVLHTAGCDPYGFWIYVEREVNDAN